MKVLVIYHSGLSSEALSFYDEYVRQGVQLDVVVPAAMAIEKTDSPSGRVVYSGQDEGKGYRIIAVPLYKPESYSAGFAFLSLYRAIQQSNPDIIHVFDEFTSLYLTQTLLCRNVIYGRRVPVLCYASQNIAFKNPPFVFESFRRFFKRLAYKIFYPFLIWFNKTYLDGATGCNSEALKIIKDVSATFPLRRTFWGVNFDIFYPQDKFICRQKFNIRKDIILVGYVGRLDKEKGIDTLLKAAAKMPQYHILIAGEGKDKESIEALIDQLAIRERVLRVSNITRQELAMLYNCFDVLVVPSKTTPTWKEQYGRVLVEAMGCRIAIVGSSSGAIPEVLEGYPKHLIFQEDDPDDLVEKITKAKDLHTPDNFDLAAFLQRFSTTTFIHSYISFYNNILSHGKI